jgi:hypothetical protein
MPRAVPARLATRSGLTVPDEGPVNRIDRRRESELSHGNGSQLPGTPAPLAAELQDPLDTGTGVAWGQEGARCESPSGASRPRVFY